MKLPRLSISKLMVLVFCLALNCFLLRQVAIYSGSLADAIVGVHIMANVLAFGTYRILSHRSKTRFNTGFVGFGFAAVFVYLGFLAMFPYTLTDVIDPLAIMYSGYFPTSSHEDNPLDLALALPFYLMIAAAITVPQLLLAMLGGWLARKTKSV